DFWQYVGKSRLRPFTFLFYILWDLLSVFVFLLSKRQHFFHFMTTFFCGRTNPSYQNLDVGKSWQWPCPKATDCKAYAIWGFCLPIYGKKQHRADCCLP
ncbi:MAG: hypothetical protein RR973_05965, partial [Anaerovoracaceae bacterium]